MLSELTIQNGGIHMKSVLVPISVFVLGSGLALTACSSAPETASAAGTPERMTVVTVPANGAASGVAQLQMLREPAATTVAGVGEDGSTVAVFRFARGQDETGSQTMTITNSQGGELKAVLDNDKHVTALAFTLRSERGVALRKDLQSFVTKGMPKPAVAGGPKPTAAADTCDSYLLNDCSLEAVVMINACSPVTLEDADAVGELSEAYALCWDASFVYFQQCSACYQTT
jgi:hypothetical protein